MILALLLTASLAAPEENTFAMVATGLEWATPDLRIEFGENLPPGLALSWPLALTSVTVVRWSECRQQLAWIPYVEPQWRPGRGDTRMVAGSQLAWGSSKAGMSLRADTLLVREAQANGWGVGAGIARIGGMDRGIRGSIELRGRYVQVPSGWRADFSLDLSWPLTPRGWRAISRGQLMDEVRSCHDAAPARDASRRLADRFGDCGEEPCDTDERSCSPMSCMPGMCGPTDDGCGGIIICKDCGVYDTPYCDPMPCLPGMCGLVDDGCGGTMSCGPCLEELLPACDPDQSCMPGMCGPIDDGCGGTLFCGPCDELPACDPVGECEQLGCGMQPDGCGGLLDCGPCDGPQTCEPTAGCTPGSCGPMPDGCGGLLDCGPCEPAACEPNPCQPGTCGAQPDGCGGTNDCGTCGL